MVERDCGDECGEARGEVDVRVVDFPRWALGAGFRSLATRSNAECQSESGITITLSGGGAAVFVATPTGVRSCGPAVKSIKPSTFNLIADIPGRGIATVPPTPTPRLAAICCAISTP
jgi:hypothetical protein